MGQTIYLVLCAGFVLYCNFQFIKFGWAIYKIAHEKLNSLFRSLTPPWLVNYQNRREEKRTTAFAIKRDAELAEVRREHYEFRNDHFVNLKFVEEDRVLLFKGHDIKWKYGRKQIIVNQFIREESHRIHYMMLTEIAVYRFKFREAGFHWTADQEKLWIKMIPKKYRLQIATDYFSRLKQQAVNDFESEKTGKAVC